MTILVWQDKSVPVFPWDTPELLRSRIAEKEGVLSSYLRVGQDLDRILEEWEEEDVEVPITVENLTKEWDKLSTTKKLDDERFVRYKTIKGEIDEQLWDTLFRHEFHDTPFQEWREDCIRLEEQTRHQDDVAEKTTQLFTELFGEEQKEMVGWKAENHRIQCRFQGRPLPEMFQDVKMKDLWRLAIFHQKTFQWGEKDQWYVKMRRLKDPSLEALLRQVQENKSSMDVGLYLYDSSSDTPVIVRPLENVGSFLLELETSDSASSHLLERVLSSLGIVDIEEQMDVGMVGSFILPQLYIDIPIFQDMCMNDPVISHFVYIDELNKTSFETQVGVRFRPSMRDVLGIETIRHADFMIKNNHRQSGFQVSVILQSPISSKKLAIFFLLMRQIMGRYLRRHSNIVKEYTHFLPQFKAGLERTQRTMIKNIKSTRPEYISKYPRMFIRNLYSVICQKNLQPTLLREDEIHSVPKESYLLFPPEPTAEINPEYYYCPNKDYPYAGLKEMDLKGQDVFINMAPCCFNSPQDKENEKKLAKLRTKDDVDDEEEEKEKTSAKTNIISGKFIIKHPGQLGTIRPPSMNRFFMAYDPFAEYFRVGTEQSTSSLLHCLLTRRSMMGIHSSMDAMSARVEMSQDEECVSACLQENPGMSVEEIRSDMANPLVYFDPRRFYRAVELFFHVRLLVFAKEADIALEDAQLLLPFSMRTHYTNHSDLPFTIVFEHWGGKTNILSKFKHPHCELIAWRPFTEPNLRFDFSPKGTFQLLENVFYKFDGNQNIAPLYRKECWFFRHVIGQTTDPLGKVRWLHFQYYNQNFYAEIDPPIAVQDDVPMGELPLEIPVLSARQMLRFLQKFDHWERIHIPEPTADLVYWTVSQDNALWKNLEENTKLRLTFVCRLDEPRPQQIQEQQGDIIRVQAPTLMLFKPENPLPSIHTHEKTANMLSQLCVSAFSHFLQKNKIEPNTIDPDELLASFQKQEIRIDENHSYVNEDQYFSGNKLVLPSFRFWDKIQFHLKWLLFYHPGYVFDTEKTKPQSLQEIVDYALADTAHYYCSLDHSHQVLKYSVENLYELSDCPMEELPSLCKKRQDLYVLWYKNDVSPYPHPSIVVLYPSYAKTLMALHYWKEERRIMTTGMLVEEEESAEEPVYEWEPSLRLWKPNGEGASMFRARISPNEYLLFFPV